MQIPARSRERLRRPDAGAIALVMAMAMAMARESGFAPAYVTDVRRPYHTACRGGNAHVGGATGAFLVVSPFGSLSVLTSWLRLGLAPAFPDCPPLGSRVDRYWHDAEREISPGCRAGPRRHGHGLLVDRFDLAAQGRHQSAQRAKRYGGRQEAPP